MLVFTGAGDGDIEDVGLLEKAARQLEEYDAGARQAFDLPLRVTGSDLQRAVCEQLPLPPSQRFREGEDAQARAKVRGLMPAFSARVSTLICCAR